MKVVAVVLMVFLGLSCLAQDSKITSAQVHYDRQEYADALVDIDQALAKPEMLKARLLPKAYLLRGKTLLRGCSKLMVMPSELSEKYEDCYLIAYNDMKKALAIAEKPKDKMDASNNIDLINSFLMQTGLNCFHEHRQTKEKALLDKAIAYYTASLEILDTGYTLYDLRGQAYIEKYDTVNAIANFERAASEIGKNVHLQADFLAPYVYYKLALIYRKSKPLKALVYVREGLAQVEKERERVRNGKAADVEQVAKGLKRTEFDLNKFNLNIHAIEKTMKENRTPWKDAAEKYPDDIKINYGYAMVLEENDVYLEAVDQYKKVLELDPSFQEGHYKLGALCWNNAVDAKQAGKEVSNEQLELALLHFEKSFDLKPEKNSVEVILQITRLLKLEDKYANYSRKKKAYGF